MGGEGQTTHICTEEEHVQASATVCMCPSKCTPKIRRPNQKEELPYGRHKG